MSQLVLSLMPGIDMFGYAFKLEGFCVVQGGDVIFGGDVRDEHYPPGKFEGIICGPPCQAFSQLKRLNRFLGIKEKFGNLIPEFERCVGEAAPEWFLMENVKQAPRPSVEGYAVQNCPVWDWKCGGKTQRFRRFSFGSREGRVISIDQGHWPASKLERAITGNCRIPRPEHIEQAKGKGGVLPGQGTLVPVEDMCESQGLPRDFRLPAMTMAAFRRAIGNGVPLSMGRAVAKAVAEAVGLEQAERSERR